MIDEPVVKASSARCPKCSAWVILSYDRCRPVRAEVVETTCPLETCKTKFEVQNDESRLWEVPESFLRRGYFYEGEISSL